jgi:hypothetical protein
MERTQTQAAAVVAKAWFAAQRAGSAAAGDLILQLDDMGDQTTANTKGCEKNVCGE